jgi:hypothetical protein
MLTVQQCVLIRTHTDNPVALELKLIALCLVGQPNTEIKVESMKFIVEVSLPLEPFNTFVRKGVAGEKIGEVLGAIQPELVYFTDTGVGRGAILIVDLADMSELPHVTEPFMLNFDASVHYRVAISMDELQAAGLDRYASA